MAMSPTYFKNILLLNTKSFKKFNFVQRCVLHNFPRYSTGVCSPPDNLKSISIGVINTGKPETPGSELLANKSWKLKIKEIQSFKDLVEYVMRERKMSFIQASYLMNQIQVIHKQQSFGNIELDYSKDDLIASDAFLRICKVLDSNLHNCRMPEINKFQSLEVLDIYCSVHKFPKISKNLESLRVSCLKFMEHCFTEKRGINETLNQLIFFANKKLIPLEIREKLLADILSFNYKDEELNILLSVTKLVFSPEFCHFINNNRELFRSFLMILYSKVDESVPPNIMKSIMSHYCIGCSKLYKGYSEDFCTKVTNIITMKEYPLPIAVAIATYLCKIPHFSFSLLEYISEKILHQETKFELFDMIKLISLFGYTNFKCLKLGEWEKFKCILQPDQFNSELYHLNTALNLAVLDIQDEKSVQVGVEHLSQNMEKSDYWNSDQRLFKWRTLLLHQYIEICLPNYSGPKFSKLDDVWEALNEDFTIMKWLDVIEFCAGSQNGVLTKCKTSLHHLIAYVIVLDESNKFVDLSQYPRNGCNVENIKLAPTHRMVLILEFMDKMKFHFKNVDACVGFCDLYIRILKKMGYNVLYIPPLKFEDLDENSRPPYFMELIKTTQPPSTS
ncbi:hypothetical protein RUM43_007774 [Polyplax serrata]|uniref:Uncharacterized protein n=1 Tax=Polyplax serrata TaxID=468196 RepID=A0AAN8PMZ8_POLSC